MNIYQQITEGVTSVERLNRQNHTYEGVFTYNDHCIEFKLSLEPAIQCWEGQLLSQPHFALSLNGTDYCSFQVLGHEDKEMIADIATMFIRLDKAFYDFRSAIRQEEREALNKILA